jgi:hypothetical protein
MPSIQPTTIPAPQPTKFGHADYLQRLRLRQIVAAIEIQRAPVFNDGAHHDAAQSDDIPTAAAASHGN